MANKDNSATVNKGGGSRLGAFLSANSMWVILISLALIMGAVTGGGFLAPRNILTILQNEAGIGILALGVAFAIISHGIDLSVGSLVSLTAVVSAAFAQMKIAGDTTRLLGDFGPLNGIVSALIGIGIGAGFGALNGWLISYTKIHPFIATLGTMSAARGMANLFTNGQPVSQLVPSFSTLGGGTILGVKSIVWFFALFCLIAWFILNQTRFGRNIFAIGGNDVAARVAGVKVELNRVAIYAWSGLCAGASGVLMAGRVNSAAPILGLNLELDAIAAATIGGVSQTGGIGRVSGIIAGVLILGIVKSALVFMRVSPFYQEIVKGIIIVAAVVIDMRKNAKRV